MKKTIISVLMAVTLVTSSLFTTSCSTVPTTTQQARIEAGLQIAAQVGGSIVLTEHPEYRQGFLTAIEDLKVIETSTNNVGISQVLTIIQRLPTKDLKSPQAILYITSGILILNQFGVPTEFPLEQSNSVKGVAKSIGAGLTVAVSTVSPNAPALMKSSTKEVIKKNSTK